MVIHMAVWKAGGCVVIPGTGAGSEGILDAVQTHHITLWLFVPALLNSYAAEKRASGRNLPEVNGIETVLLGGDMITRDALRKAAEEFPRAEVIVAHGMTEGGGLFNWPFREAQAAEVPHIREISPLGDVAKGVRVRIRDAESGKVVKKGDTGELLFSSKCVIQHYLDHTHPEAFLQEDGRQWFRTGDLATITADGLVYILGRIKDRIKRAAIPIEPAALESCVAAFTASTASVIGWPHPEMGEAPLAIVENLNGKTTEQILEEVIRKFGPEYALEKVITLEQLGLRAWPLNATGKIMKTELKSAVGVFFDNER
jgi:4-coumarate--CoA ligase